MQKTPWIERQFNFDLPITMFPNVLERLRGAPARITDRIQDIRADSLSRSPDGSWSILQHIGHLSQVETIWLQRLDDFDNGVEVLTPADMSNRATEEAEYNSADSVDLLTAFRDVRGQFVQRLEAMTDAEAARSARHPRLDQPMRVIDLMVFAAEHDDHHLTRITELLRT
ncbi:DinB family protein [bacterium]|nr:DinB family protein [bacterium]